MRLIDADALIDRMYYEAFENDESYNESNPMARWDSGLWIRYKMFENVIADQPTIEPKQDNIIKSNLQPERSACDTCVWANSGIPCRIESGICKREVR